MKLNLGAGSHPLDGFDNRDRNTGWHFEDGLPDIVDRSVEAITISHALMYVPEQQWASVFDELARVLAPGGVVRVTEDNTVDPDSERFGGYPGAVTLTHPALVDTHLRDAGLKPFAVSADSTRYRDRSLIQRWHGDPPKVFHIEGVCPAA